MDLEIQGLIAYWAPEISPYSEIRVKAPYTPATLYHIIRTMARNEEKAANIVV
jgi:hypothetical protein